jgi:hypothetical protein
VLRFSFTVLPTAFVLPNNLRAVVSGIAAVKGWVKAFFAFPASNGYVNILKKEPLAKNTFSIFSG